MQVQSLVGELRSRKPCAARPKKKKEKEKKIQGNEASLKRVGLKEQLVGSQTKEATEQTAGFSSQAPFSEMA